MKFEYLTDSNTYFRFIPTWTRRLQIYTDSGKPTAELDRLGHADFRVGPTWTPTSELDHRLEDADFRIRPTRTPTSELDRLEHADFRQCTGSESQNKMSASMKMTQVEQDDETDLFKPEYKKYKRKDKALDLSDVIDFSTGNSSLIREYNLQKVSHPAVHGLRDAESWKAYCLEGFPGFIFINNPFKHGCQKYWIERCVLDFPQRPCRTNLDVLMDTEKLGNIWDTCQLKEGKQITGKDSLMMNLRWVTMGYNYEWNTRAYYDEMKTPFPNDLWEICRYVAAAIGYPEFSAETTIVNYYHTDHGTCSMGPHKDISEIDHDAPLLSFSFGQDSLFLLGGLDRSTKPVCLYMHSGDICIMSKDCRLVYHAMPRILRADDDKLSECFDFDSSYNGCETCELHRLQEDEHNDKQSCDMKINGKDRSAVDYKLLKTFMDCTRVNMNVRQVLPPGGKAIKDYEQPVCPSSKTGYQMEMTST
ncbi:hypothetical protein FSP39_004758 [Pinctada imbricata]|uniref:Fe2OG dioxygenase domain-containing protein n=1 Tax=Pinctada imbricata TaxID=66713 RepID=A0AA88XVF3_PINIB|nr:hypothetical protein FSP39_004758 [Pinctada imbricata]